MTTTTFGQNPIVNFDIGEQGTPYVGLGALPDNPANTTWNDIGGSSGTLFASDGTPLTGTSLDGLSIQFQGLSSTDGNVAQTNSLLKDYQFISVYFGPQEGNISISGLKQNTDYELYVYASGDKLGQGTIIILNDEFGLTDGTPAGTIDFELGKNYVVMEVRSDDNGEINGNWYPLKSADGPAGTGAINGMQIRESTLDTRIIAVSSVDSPTVYSPGDTFEIILTFSEEVSFSQVSASTVNLDFGGGAAGIVTALHAGPVVESGKSNAAKHRFIATAPGVGSPGANVLANSLQLNGVSLTDEAMQDVPLAHNAFALPYIQVSMQKLSVYSTEITDPDTPQSLPQIPLFQISRSRHVLAKRQLAIVLCMDHPGANG